MRRIELFAAALGFAASSLWIAQPAQAQAFTPDKADRAAAVKEGSLSWYTSTPFPLVQKLVDRFQQDTGIRIQLLRSGGEAVIRRVSPKLRAKAPMTALIAPLAPITGTIEPGSASHWAIAAA